MGRTYCETKIGLFINNFKYKPDYREQNKDFTTDKI